MRTKQQVEEIITELCGKIALLFPQNEIKAILFGSYARGDFGPESDIDIMILLDLPDMEVCKYRKRLSGLTYDFNEEHDTDIKPIAKSKAHCKKWLDAYPFYANVQREGVELYGTS